MRKKQSIRVRKIMLNSRPIGPSTFRGPERGRGHIIRPGQPRFALGYYNSASVFCGNESTSRVAEDLEDLEDLSLLVC